jgi:hypothetical protein
LSPRSSSWSFSQEPSSGGMAPASWFLLK